MLRPFAHHGPAATWAAASLLALAGLVQAGPFEPAESGGGFLAGNLAAVTAGAVPFARDEYGANHTIKKLNDGCYGNTDSWIGRRDRSFAGVRLPRKAEISAIAFGRDNTGHYTDRCIGTYHVQYTAVDRPDENTPNEEWTTIAVVDYGASPPPHPARRHLFRFPTVTATGVRIVTARDERKATHLLAIDEIELYGPDAELPAVETVDWTPALVDPAKLPPPWKSPLVKKGKLDSPLVEVTPFVFRGRFTMLENWRASWPRPEPLRRMGTNQPQIAIRDVQTDEILSVAMTGRSLGVAFVWDDRVYAFAAHDAMGRKEISMAVSDDLKNWSDPVAVLKADPDETFFNVSVCRGEDRFVMLVETNDPAWPAFTFKYFESDDLVRWRPVPGALYGADKYVGGPALYYLDDTYYTLYLESLGSGRYETRVTRSKDLVHWQDAPDDRPLVTFDPDQLVHPIRSKTIHECNASDAELVYWKGKTLVYYTGGDQHAAGDLQWAEFDGTPKELLELHFE